MQIIQRVRLLDLVTHTDNRGSLVALEEGGALPFVPKRIFFITDSDSQSVRGEHAGSSEELIVAMSGAVTIELDNGEQQTSLRLAEPDKALWLRPGVWLRLKEFEAGTILLVAASRIYAETRHFERPQPFPE